MAAPGIPVQILGKELLVPLRLTVSWSCPCPGYAAMVLLPTHEISVVTRIGLAPDVPSIARQVQPSAGRTQWLHEGRGTPPHGTPDGPKCWREGRVAGYLPIESEAVPPLLARYVAMAGATEPDGPVRGRWRARLLLDQDGPTVALARQVASYAELQIWSDPKTGRWNWTVQRLGRWYSAEAKAELQGDTTLRNAIHEAFRQAQVMVAEACVQRDTGRRAAFDPGYAAAHPRAQRKPPAEQVVAGAEKAAGQGRKPKIPGVREASAALEAAVAPLRAAGVRVILQPPSREGWPWAVGIDGHEVARFRTFDQAARALRGRRLTAEKELPSGEQIWIGGRRRKAAPAPAPAPVKPRATPARRGAKGDPALAEAPEQAPSTPATVAKVARAAVQLGAEVVRMAGTDATAALERARRLIRAGDALVRSPLCRGPEQEEAKRALVAARLAYGQARKALSEHGERAPAALRRAAEKGGLAAARAAKACGAGQLQAPPPPAPASRRSRNVPAAAPAAPPKKRNKRAAPADKDARLMALFQAALGSG